MRFRGNVQGVGFRAHVQFHCRASGIAGWVRNLDDGSVEGVLIGSEEVLGETLRRVHAGRAHQLTSVDKFEIPVPDQVAASFEILP